MDQNGTYWDNTGRIWHQGPRWETLAVLTPELHCTAYQIPPV